MIELDIPNGCYIGVRCFENCQNLIIIFIGRKVSIDNDPFNKCSKINFIFCNKNELKIQKDMLFVKNNIDLDIKPIIKEILLLQTNTYQMLINQPMLSNLYGFINKLGLIEDVLPIISLFEGKENVLYQLYKNDVDKIALPKSRSEMVIYKKDLDKILTDIKDKTTVKSMSAPLLLKIEMYANHLQKLIIQKIECDPSFFKSNPTILRNSFKNHSTVRKLIYYLKFNNDVNFKAEEIQILREGFIGETISSFNINLLELPSIDEVNSIKL